MRKKGNSTIAAWLFTGLIVLTIVSISASAQTDIFRPDTAFKEGGKVWASGFGDVFYKAHADAYSRGTVNSYIGIEKGRNGFQSRGLYLGYDYNIHRKFFTELILASEDNYITESGAVNGDLLPNSKLAFFIKNVDLRWKNIWKGTDLVIGTVSTPAFGLLTGPIWNYRSIERTIADIHRVPSNDLGVALQGKLDGEGNFGYDVMVGNGTGARPEGDRFKYFYGDVFAKFFNKKLVLDLYADYNRLNWSPGFHHSKNMIKGFIAYTTKPLTVGVEAFVQHARKDELVVTGGIADTVDATAKAISVYVRGSLWKDKWGYFIRFDHYDPNTKYEEQKYNSYKALSANTDPNNVERLFTAGLDFTPIKNVHIMPNVWYNGFTNKRTIATDALKRDHDLVFRITLFYVYNK